VNKQQLLKLIGTVVSLRPRPQSAGTYIPHERNRWHVIDRTEDNTGLVLKNVITDHEFIVLNDNIDQYRAPALLLLRGQPLITGQQSVSVEPFIDAPEVIEDEDPPEFVAERLELAQGDLKKLTDTERLAVRELLVRDKMTDTDVSQFLENKGLGPYPQFYQSVSNKVAFLERDFFGNISVMSSFKMILKRLFSAKLIP